MKTKNAKKRSIAKGGFAIVATGVLLPLFHVSAPVAYAQSQKDAQKMFKQADKNRDGNISWSEVLDMRKSVFYRLDRNKDGFVDKTDRPSFFGSQFDKAFERFVEFDTDGDNRVSRQELLDGEAPAFEEADTNKDKILSAEEIEAMRAKQ